MGTILYPLMVPVAWVMVQFHDMLTWLGIDPHSGLSWALSIVGLVIVMRIILIPLFVRQIRAARGMQMLSPELQALQKKYKGRQDPASREAMSREMMELYRKHGTNPFASCLPILAQSPIFFALFQVLYNMPRLADGEYARESIGPMTQSLARDFTEATLFGARLSDWFLASETTNTKIVAAVLIVLMSATTFFTQKQLTQKNMPASAMQGPMAQQQKMLLYLLPVIFAVSGVNFPLGVLIYWTTTNVWSMGQQFYVIRRNPTPGSEAERRMKERRARKAAAKGIVLDEEPEEPEKPRGQRQQPTRKGRARPRPDGEGRPGAAGQRKPGSGSGASKPGAQRPKKPGTGSAPDGQGPARPGGQRPARSGGQGSGRSGSGKSDASGDGRSGAEDASSKGPRPPRSNDPARRRDPAERRRRQQARREREAAAGTSSSGETAPEGDAGDTETHEPEK